MKNYYKILFLLFIPFIFDGCLKDPPITSYKVELQSGVEILSYLESEGNYINSDSFPNIVNAEEVYNNLSNYLLIDVRTNTDYSNGHVQNSLNVIPDSLLNFMNTINANDYQKIVFISNTGQSASYYCCLMILDGYNNVYAMKFGMAAWNNDFSSDWLNALDNSSSLYLSGVDYPKAELSPLPSLIFTSNDVPVKSKLEERIKILLSEGFEEKIQTNFSSPVISFRDLVLNRDSTNYIVCLGDRSFYVSYFGMSHFVGAVNYNFAKPFSELESTKYLQTIPSKKEIDLYSYSGHISAFITAYLRILGYNAKSILFGGNNLVYTAMLSTPGLPQYVFQISDINNYPYVTGN